MSEPDPDVPMLAQGVEFVATKVVPNLHPNTYTIETLIHFNRDDGIGGEIEVKGFNGWCGIHDIAQGRRYRITIEEIKEETSCEPSNGQD